MLDKGYCPTRWEFDAKITDAFEDMLRRSIPQYEIMRKAIVDIVIKEHPDRISDVGCSRGDMIADLLKVLPDIEYYGYEISEPMLSAAKARFKDNKNVHIKKIDLRGGMDLSASPSFCLCILTLQFIPMEHRQKLITEMAQTQYGLILVEKVLGSDANINKTFVSLYEKMKLENGYSEEDVLRKKMSLEGVLVPVTAKWNEELLKMAGFKSFDCFWRWMNFAGWFAK